MLRMLLDNIFPLCEGKEAGDGECICVHTGRESEKRKEPKGGVGRDTEKK